MSERLERIIASAGSCAVVCDIGCDHAYVPIELVKRGAAERAIACDIRPGPLLQARRNVEEAGLSDRISLRLGDGLKEVKAGEAELVILSGMGGRLMEEILRGRLLDFQSFLLSPQSEPERVRALILREGLSIAGEEMLSEDGKYYLILRAERRKAGEEREEVPYSEIELLYGRKLLLRRDIVLRAFLERERARYEEILKRTDKAEILREAWNVREALERYET